MSSQWNYRPITPSFHFIFLFHLDLSLTCMVSSFLERPGGEFAWHISTSLIYHLICLYFLELSSPRASNGFKILSGGHAIRLSRFYEPFGSY